LIGGRPWFTHAPALAADAEFQADQMYNRGLAARCFNWGKKLVNSDYAPLDQLRRMVAHLPEGAALVELGSGNRRLRPGCLNIDLFPFPNVDVVADIHAVPLRDGIADAVVLDTVLEHVPEPQRVVDETFRILKPGGQVLCIAPFVFPYHGYPRHYYNFSRDGLEYLFRAFSDCSVAMNIGPTSCLTHLLSEYGAVALSGMRALPYTVCKGLLLLPLFSLKFLDRFWARSPHGHRLASTLCAVARK